MILRSFGRRVKSIGFTSAASRGVRRVQIGRSLLETEGDDEKDRTVYVGNLCYDTSQRDLMDAFRSCGAVYNVHIPFDTNENRIRGFGFVTFVDEEAAQHAKITMDGIELSGRPLNVGSVHKKRKDGPISFQKSRPWRTPGEGNNLDRDNSVEFNDIFSGRRVALFGVVAPFTGICTEIHLPGYISLASRFSEKVDDLVCMSVTDPYVLDAWVKSLGAESSPIQFLADPSGAVAKHLGVYRRQHDYSLGMRCSRFSMLVEDGKIIVYSEAENADEDAQWLLDRC